MVTGTGTSETESMLETSIIERREEDVLPLPHLLISSSETEVGMIEIDIHTQIGKEDILEIDTETEDQDQTIETQTLEIMKGETET